MRFLNSTQDLLRQIPKVDLLLDLIPDQIASKVDHNHVKLVITEALDELRNAIIKRDVVVVDLSDILYQILKKLEKRLSPSLKRVINGTGIILHTNLGRAVLSENALNHLKETMTHYNTLEYDLSAGKRGSRYMHVEELICRLTGSEAALVVNNNAAAVMLILNTLAKDKEVIISRGELVEIGGSFRVPDVMTASGCKLVEVGTTNKTHLRDFSSAITEDTGLILKVHTSNFQILGFTHTVDREHLAQLCHENQLPFYEDLGSGALLDLSQLGLKREPLIEECLKAGVDIVSFSGDKLLGASQAGIIAGRKIYIDALKQNQLLRALRIDKLSLSILEWTLIEYLNSASALTEIPTIKMLGKSADDILAQITHFIKSYQSDLDLLGVRYAIDSVVSQVGGGTLPLEELPSYALTIRGDFQPNAIQAQMRALYVPIICKIDDDALHVDFRTVFEDDYDWLMDGLKRTILGDTHE